MALKHVYDLTKFKLSTVFLVSSKYVIPSFVVEIYPAGKDRYVVLCWYFGLMDLSFYKVFFVESNTVSAAVGAIVRDLEKECGNIFDVVVEVVE